MTAYQTLFFDIDNTLLDFDASEKMGLKRLFEQHQLAFSTENVAAYQHINHGLWEQFEKGEITREEVVMTRFEKLFKQMNVDVNGELLEQEYRRYLDEGHDLLPGAMELIEQLAPDYRLFVVTNGVSKTQYRRLTDAKLIDYFEAIFVSEDTGYQKPMPAFFDYVFERVPHFDLKSSLIIGDSLTSDIQGGLNVGMDSVWFNPERIQSENIQPTYMIHSLNELLTVLKGDGLGA